jgi:16S rRNA (cytosine967-C5)-methyltransferase
MKNSARREVLSALLRVFSGGYSNIVLSETLLKKLSGEDRAFASGLFFGVLERRITLEEILKKFVKRRPPEEVETILLMGLYQILYMNSVPDFAAVSSSVELCRNKKFSSLVNGVLRAVLREDREKLMSFKSENVKYSVSEKVYETVKNSLSEDTDAFFEDSFGSPPLFVRVNTNKTDPETLAKTLEEKNIKSEKTIFPYALRIYYSGDITATQEYKEGCFYTSDLSSLACVSALGIKAGDCVGDMCAAPGGKSFSAALFGGRLYSFDIYENKVDIIRKGAKRLGLENIKASVLSAEEVSGRENSFDKIICDVPCSGIGVIRRKPEIRYKNEDFSSLIEKQRKIMSVAARCLKKGGRMVYSTCSVTREENEENVKWFLSEHPDFRLLNCEEFNGIIKRNSFGSLITPSDFMSDGFYFSVLEKIK